MFDLVDTTLLVLRRGSRVAALATLLLVGATVAPGIALALTGIPPLLVALAFFAFFFLVVPVALAAPFAAYAKALDEEPRLLETLRAALALAPRLLPATLCSIVPAVFIPTGVLYAFRVLSHEKIPGAEGLAAPFLPLMIPVGLGVWVRYVAVPAAAIALERSSWREANARAHSLCRRRPFLLGFATGAPLVFLLALIPTGPSQEAIHAVFSVQGVAVVRFALGFAALMGALLLTGALGVAGYRVASHEE